jgi:hypothetical protein
MNDVLKKVATVIGAEHHFTTPCAPWANGQVEHVNKEVKELMCALLLEGKLDETLWPKVLPIVQSIINNSPSEVLGGKAPIEVMCCLEKNVPLAVVYHPEASDVLAVELSAPEVTAKIKAWQEQAKQMRAEVADVPVRQAPSETNQQEVDFKVGDYVLMSAVVKPGRGKLKPRWIGPVFC